MSDKTPCVSSVEKGKPSSLKKTYKVVIVPSESAQEILARRKEARRQAKEMIAPVDTEIAPVQTEIRVNSVDITQSESVEEELAGKRVDEVEENSEELEHDGKLLFIFIHYNLLTIYTYLFFLGSSIYTALSSLTINTKSSNRATDESFKAFAMETPLQTYLSFNCGSSCQIQRNASHPNLRNKSNLGRKEL